MTKNDDPNPLGPGVHKSPISLEKRWDECRTPLTKEQTAVVHKLVDLPSHDMVRFTGEIERNIYVYRGAEEKRSEDSAKRATHELEALSKHLIGSCTLLRTLGRMGYERLLEMMLDDGVDDPELVIDNLASSIRAVYPSVVDASEVRVGKGAIGVDIQARLVYRLVLSCFKFGVMDQGPEITTKGRKLAKAVLNFAGYPSTDPREPIRRGYSMALEFVNRSQ